LHRALGAVPAISQHQTIGLPLDIDEVISKPYPLAVGAVERGPQPCVLRFEVLGGGIGTAMDLGEGAVQIGFGLARDLDLAAQMLEL